MKQQSKTCEHEWVEVESIHSNEKFVDVKCTKCQCPGIRNEETSEIYRRTT
jgi:hypothetical protein